MSTVPGYLFPVDVLTSGDLQALGAPELKTDESGAPKANQHFPGKTPYMIRAELIRGMRAKKLPSGKTIEVADSDWVTVTIWVDGAAPAVEAGDYFRLIQPMVGAIEGNIFIQSMGCEVVTAEETLDSLLGTNEKMRLED